jgi:hypothetical protein
MAIEKKIKISVDSSEADSGLKALESQLAKTDKEAGKLNETATQTSKQGNVFSKMSSGLNDLVPGFSGAVTGGKAMLKTMWLLVANPIGAVVAALVLGLGLLYKAFTSTKAGGEQLERAMAGIGAVIDVLRDRVLKVGEALVKFFSGDFKGAIQAGKDSVKGFGAEVTKEFQQASKALKDLQEVADEARNLDESRAKLNRDLAESERILTSTTATYQEKKKALAEVTKAEKIQTDSELANAKKKLAAILSQNDASDSDTEALQKKSDAQKAVYALEQKSSEDRRKVSEFEKTLSNNEAARVKGIQDEASARQKVIDDKRIERNKLIKAEKDALIKEELDRREKELADQLAIEMKSAQESFNIIDELNKSKETPAEKEQREYEEKLSILEENNLSTELLTQIHLENLNKINNDYFAKEADQRKKDADDDINIAKQVADAKASIQDAYIGNVGAGFALLGQLAGKNKALQAAAIIGENAVGIAKQVISTRAANTAVTAKYALLPGGLALAATERALNNVSLGIGIASSALATKKALSSLGTGGDTGSGQGGNNAPQRQAPSFNLVQGTASNQIAESLQSKNAPIKAYVVSTDVTSSQSLDRNILSNSRLG